MIKPTPKADIHIASRASLPLYRSVNSIDILTRYAADHGIDAYTLLSGNGIKPQDLNDPEVFIHPEQELAVMRRLAAFVRDPCAGLRVGDHYHITAHGALGSAAICCETLLDAIRMVFSYIELTLTYFRYDLKVQGACAHMTMRELAELGDIRRFICEREFVSVHRMMSDLIGEPLVLQEASFAYPEPEYADRYGDFFGCRIVFGADEHGFIFDRTYLSRGLPMANRLWKDRHERECRELFLRLKRHETVSDRVRQTIQCQRDGMPTFEEVARRLNLSPRTLNRRLSAEGTTYKGIIADIRKKKAIQLLTETSSPMESIALELGYNDVANFYHAFKRWTRCTPGSYREKTSPGSTR